MYSNIFSNTLRSNRVDVFDRIGNINPHSGARNNFTDVLISIRVYDRPTDEVTIGENLPRFEASSRYPRGIESGGARNVSVGGPRNFEKGQVFAREVRDIKVYLSRLKQASVYTGRLAVDIVGLIWRSGINQRANILRVPVMQPARRRSFYRRSKTIRIYIRASAPTRRVAAFRPVEGFLRDGTALRRAYGMAYWSGGRASAAITALLPAGFFGCASKWLSLFPLRATIFLTLFFVPFLSPFLALSRLFGRLPAAGGEMGRLRL